MYSWTPKEKNRQSHSWVWRKIKKFRPVFFYGLFKEFYHIDTATAPPRNSNWTSRASVLGLSLIVFPGWNTDRPVYRKPIWAAFRRGASVQKYAIFISAHAPAPARRRNVRTEIKIRTTRGNRGKPEIRVNWNSDAGSGGNTGPGGRARFGIALVNCPSSRSNYTSII